MTYTYIFKKEKYLSSHENCWIYLMSFTFINMWRANHFTNYWDIYYCDSKNWAKNSSTQTKVAASFNQHHWISLEKLDRRRGITYFSVSFTVTIL